ncbi:MAG TPA: hypothetical protein VM869_28905, partial [Enhygromyxa sp.]|nr:hypothetical protein [Enhygromyxa sp.]
MLLTSLALVSDCAGERIRVAKQLETIDGETLGERARLGHVGAYGELADAEDRARAAARVAVELGNADEAGAFAEEQLELARTRLLIVRLENGDPTLLEQAHEKLDEAARFAVRIGDEVLDAQLVIE